MNVSPAPGRGTLRTSSRTRDGNRDDLITVHHGDPVVLALQVYLLNWREVDLAGAWWHEEERVPTPIPLFRDQGPQGPRGRLDNQTQKTIGLEQARPFGASLVDRQLLAKRKILKDEAPAAGQSQVEQSNEPENEGDHCYQSARTPDPAVKRAWAQALQSKWLRSFGERQELLEASAGNFRPPAGTI